MLCFPSLHFLKKRNYFGWLMLCTWWEWRREWCIWFTYSCIFRKWTCIDSFQLMNEEFVLKTCFLSFFFPCLEGMYPGNKGSWEGPRSLRGCIQLFDGMPFLIFLMRWVVRYEIVIFIAKFYYSNPTHILSIQ